MTNIPVKYPALIIKEDDNNLYALSNGLGLISRGGHTFYKGALSLIDSSGNMYSLTDSSILGRATFWESLKYFQPMYQMQLQFTHVSKLTLEDIKNILKEHVKKSSKHWLALDTPEGLKETINSKDNIADLITMFK